MLIGLCNEADFIPQLSGEDAYIFHFYPEFFESDDGSDFSHEGPEMIYIPLNQWGEIETGLWKAPVDYEPSVATSQNSDDSAFPRSDPTGYNYLMATVVIHLAIWYYVGSNVLCII